MNDFITQQFSSYNLFQVAAGAQDDVKGVACERISQDV
jgi:hypothetical protein